MKKYRSERKGRRSFDTAIEYSRWRRWPGKRRGPQKRRSALPRSAALRYPLASKVHGAAEIKVARLAL